MWHSTFCQFLNVKKHLYWSSQQTQTQFGIFKLLCNGNPVRVLPYIGVPKLDIFISPGGIYTLLQKYTQFCLFMM